MHGTKPTTPEELRVYRILEPLERRSLVTAIQEGIDGANNFTDCVSNARAQGVYGERREVVSCEETIHEGSEAGEGCLSGDGPCQKCKTELKPR